MASKPKTSHLREASVKHDVVGPIPQHRRLALGENINGSDILPEDQHIDGQPSIRNPKQRY